MKAMMDELLAVKRRRENGMRARIDKIARTQQSLMCDVRCAREEVTMVLKEWNALLKAAGTHSHEEFTRLRAQLTEASVRERSLKERIVQLQNEHVKLSALMEEQMHLLGKVLKSQEKLKFLRDEWTENE
jgi:ElaB/YqjD/DUF883 family membrane-anchored ribosome-binding protein